MTTQERIDDMMLLGLFEKEELEVATDIEIGFSVFKSWEYYAIYHLSNEELYYLPEEVEISLVDTADEIEDTKKGRIYMYK